jgi:hypothetical protein
VRSSPGTAWYWPAALAAIRRCCNGHAPGKVPSWLAGVLLASPSVLGPGRLVAGGPWPDHPAWTWRAASRDPS